MLITDLQSVGLRLSVPLVRLENETGKFIVARGDWKCWNRRLSTQKNRDMAVNACVG